MVYEKETIKVKGMTCTSCEDIIKKEVTKNKGVKSFEIDYATQIGLVSFDPEKTSMKKILGIIEEAGYNPKIIGGKAEKDFSGSYAINKKVVGYAIGIVGFLLIAYFVFGIVDTVRLPQISQNMGYGLLLLVGLLTGFHCVSMCGGFVLGYTTKNSKEGKSNYNDHFMYGAGKTISYTIIGAGFGLLGSIFAFTPLMRGVAGILAGLFLIIFGLNMLGFLSPLRRLRLRTPKFVSRFVRTESTKHKSPLVIGLLNGLMIACGPLQAIYIMAAGTGSALEGAKVLFLFGLGTLPVMLGFGFLASFLSNKATNKILKASGFVVILLGVIMVNRGLALSGTGFDTNTLVANVLASNDASLTDEGSALEFEDGYQIIRMTVNRYGWEPDKFVLKKGVPTKWIIDGVEINGCNNAIQVPKYNLKFDVEYGEQVIEFTPTKEGVISWSCWMGMIPGVFVVKEDIDLSDASAVQGALEEVVVPSGGSCGGGGGGGCGCGGGR
ncbi:hypothetical protein GOV05_04825 [Candidatus Woesearchaeota archaeon]|nr:hypothetical protein [Candidatus Woesearchaeota archaeon]